MRRMRDRIVRAAGDHFVRRGFDGTSMREIAADCGITKAALYYHFTGKAELLSAVFTDYLDEVSKIVANPAAGADPEARLRSVIRGVFALPAERRSILRVAMHDVDRLDDVQRASFNEAYHRRFLDPLRGIFADGIASGDFVDGDPDFFVKLVLGTIYPFFAPRGPVLDSGGSLEVELLLDVLCTGLCRPRTGE